MAYRRFGYLHAKLLLYQQHEWPVLKQRLGYMDQEESIGMTEMARDGLQQRKDFLDLIKQMLYEYIK
jgi:hypothetical protein